MSIISGSAAAVSRRSQRQTAYVELASRAASAKNEDELLAVVATFVPKVLNVPRASLALLCDDDEGQSFSVIVLGGEAQVFRPGSRNPSAGTAVGLACAEQRTISTLEFRVADFGDWSSLNASQGLEHFIVNPLMISGKATGTFNIGMPAGYEIDESDVQFARQFSQVVATNLELRQTTARLSRSLQELRRTQEQLVQQEKLNALRDVVAGFAHELNTPLGVAITALSLSIDQLQSVDRMLKGPAISRRALVECIQSAEHSGRLCNQNLQRAARLVSDLKAVASGQNAIGQCEYLDLSALVSSTLDSLSPMAREHAVELNTVIASQVFCHTDREVIAAVLTNLLQNTCVHAFDENEHDSSSPREVTITVTQATGSALVRVRDNGKGIPPHQQSRIFEPFYTTRRGRGGTGLGLHVSQSAALAMGGDLQLVTSRPGHTEFLLSLPLEEAASGAKAG